MATTGSLELLERTLAQTGAIIIDRVRPEQATLPTPCASWDVRALVNHVMHDVQQFTEVVAGDAPVYDRLAGYFGRDPR